MLIPVNNLVYKYKKVFLYILTSTMVHHIIPLLSTALYFYFPQNIVINKEVIHKISLIHNIILSCFSFYIFIILSKFMFNHGIVIEKGYYFSFDQFDDILFYFYISKYVEYIDTFLIYLKGKKPIFLQLYHHSGAVISWHLAYTYKLDCFWIPTLLNSFVHTIMYTYYILSLFKVEFIRVLKKYITILQISQLLFLFTALILYKNVETEVNWNIMLLCGFANVIQIYLFIDFYNKNYNNRYVT
jgi:hypothetical protein